MTISLLHLLQNSWDIVVDNLLIELTRSWEKQEASPPTPKVASYVSRACYAGYYHIPSQQCETRTLLLGAMASICSEASQHIKLHFLLVLQADTLDHVSK